MATATQERVAFPLGAPESEEPPSRSNFASRLRVSWISALLISSLTAGLALSPMTSLEPAGAIGLAVVTGVAWALVTWRWLVADLDGDELTRLLTGALVVAPALGVLGWLTAAAVTGEAVGWAGVRPSAASAVAATAAGTALAVGALTLADEPLRVLARRDVIQALLILLLLTGLVISPIEVPDVVIAPALVWLAWRWHERGAALGAALVGVVTVAAGVASIGRYGRSMGHHDVTHLATFIALACVGALVFALVSRQRDDARAAEVENLAQARLGLAGTTRTYKTLLGNLSGVAYRCTFHEWRAEFISDGATEIFGWTPAEFVSGAITFNQLIYERDLEYVRGDEVESLRMGNTFTKVYRICHRSGEARWVAETGRVVGQETGDLAIEGFILDVTDSHRIELEAREHASALSRTLQGGSLAASIEEICTEFVDSWSATAITITRIDPKSASIPLAEVTCAPSSDSEMATWNFSQSIGLSEGASLVAVVTSTSQPSDKMREALYRLTELLALIAEQEHAKGALEHAAHHDWLGIPNRRAAETAIDEALDACRNGRRHSVVLVVDPTRFRQLNETFGFAVGDSVLLAISERILQVQSVVSVARVSGSAFVVVAAMAEMDDDQQMAIAREIQAMVEMPFTVGAQTLKLTAGIGYSSCKPNSASAGDDRHSANASLLREAHLAVNESRKNPSLPCKFEPRIGMASDRRARLTNSLLRALDAGSIEVHYQPEIDLQTGKIFGVEALARWRNGDEIVDPDEFIPIAEESGFIVPLGLHVLQRALTDLSEWDCLISVNVSPLQIVDPSFARHVESALQQSGVDPARLCLEVTETALRDALLTRQVLQEVKTLGVAIAIDDFGTGYSSLSQLTQLPLDYLKVDQSFVLRLGQGMVDDDVVQTMVLLGGSLKLQVIAEGVENAQQEDRLNELGCHLVQGWHYSRAVPQEKLPNLFRAWA